MKIILKLLLLLSILLQSDLFAQDQFKIGLGSGAMFGTLEASKIGMTSQVKFEYLPLNSFSLFISTGYCFKGQHNENVVSIEYLNFNLGAKYYFYSQKKLKPYIALELGEALGRYYSDEYYPRSFVQTQYSLPFVNVFRDRPNGPINERITVADLGAAYQFMSNVEADLSVGAALTSKTTGVAFIRLLAGLSITL